MAQQTHNLNNVQKPKQPFAGVFIKYCVSVNGVDFIGLES